MNILEKIIRDKHGEVARRKAVVPVAQLEGSEAFLRVPVSMRDAILAHPEGGVIAEFKRRSPSKGVIREAADADAIARGYEKAGAAGISVLTDSDYFGGGTDDLRTVRTAVSAPLLRKDFIIDAYQVYETKAMGADVLLLIAAAMDSAVCHELTRLAVSLGLEVLLELHDEAELGHYTDDVALVGINNRDLRTFTVDLEHSHRMAARLPSGVVKVAESGLSDVEKAKYLRDRGFQGFLIGEHFMRQSDPGRACASFISSLTT